MTLLRVVAIGTLRPRLDNVANSGLRMQAIRMQASGHVLSVHFAGSTLIGLRVNHQNYSTT